MGEMDLFREFIIPIIVSAITAMLISFPLSKRLANYKLNLMIKQRHFGDIKKNLLIPLLDWIKELIPKIENRTTDMSFSSMIEYNYSPTGREEYTYKVNQKLHENSLVRHFPSLAHNLKSLNKRLADYDSKYVEFARWVQNFLRRHQILEEKLLDKFTNITTYQLLKSRVPKNYLVRTMMKLGAGKSVILSDRVEKISREINLKRSKKWANLAKNIITISPKIRSEATKLKDTLEDLMKQPKLKGKCKYCEI